MIPLSHSFLFLLTFFFSSFHSCSLSKNLFSHAAFLVYHTSSHCPCLSWCFSYTLQIFLVLLGFFLVSLDLVAFLLSLTVISTPHLSVPLCSTASLTPSSLPPLPVCPSLSSRRLWTIWSRGWRRQASRSAFARVSSPTRLSLSRTSRCFD